LTRLVNSLTHETFRSKTEFREFPGRTHLIIAEPSFEPIVVATIDWIREEVLKQ
jgi:hypothetical protein